GGGAVGAGVVVVGGGVVVVGVVVVVVGFVVVGVVVVVVVEPGRGRRLGCATAASASPAAATRSSASPRRTWPAMAAGSDGKRRRPTKGHDPSDPPIFQQ